MAPLRPVPSACAAPTKSILKKPSTSKSSQSESLFPTNKKDKRAIKHAQLMSRVAKSANSKPRRRRPNKKLVTTLDALADALPDDGLASNADTLATTDLNQHVNIIQRKSLKSRPGAMKRREKLDQGERDRFAKNMAQMTGASGTGQNGEAPSQESRWKALRGFIAQTMEKKPSLSTIQ